MIIKEPKMPKVLIATGEGHITEVEMIKGLHQAGINIHAMLVSRSPNHRVLQEAGVPTRALDLRSNVDLINAMRIRRWIRDEKFDIVHGLANWEVSNFIWASYGLPNKVIAYRGAVGHVSRWDPTCYLKWLNPRIDKIICVSKAVQRDLLANGVKPNKLITIYKGHDLSWYAHLDRKAARIELEAEFGIPREAILVGMAANMRRVKGADLLLRALMQLPDQVHGVFIGEVRDPELRKLASDQTLAGRVHFTGFRSNAPYLIGALDINVAPSRGREGLTKTVIEGMVQEVPAVVSEAGGLPEMVDQDQTGYIFPIDNLPYLVEILSKMIMERKRWPTLGANSLKKAHKEFAVTKTIEQTKNLYLSLLNKKNQN